MHFTKAKGILSSSNGMNLYRGCSHGCIYCGSRSKCYHSTPAKYRKTAALIVISKPPLGYLYFVLAHGYLAATTTVFITVGRLDIFL